MKILFLVMISSVLSSASWSILWVFLTVIGCVPVVMAMEGNGGSLAEPDVGGFQWPDGKRAAVSLTFDDARPSQLVHGLSVFDEFGIKVTFYLSPANLEQHIPGWQRAVAAGHEMGNHTLHHPCTGNFAFAREKALENYTLEAMARELDEANAMIRALLGVEPVSFAYPCGQTFVGRGKEVRSYVPLVAERFVSGRLWLSEDANDPGFCDLSQLLARESDGKDFEELKALADDAGRRARWLILAGHEIADAGPQTTRLADLRRLCAYLTAPENGFWVQPVGVIGRYVEARNRGAAEAAP